MIYLATFWRNRWMMSEWWMLSLNIYISIEVSNSMTTSCCNGNHVVGNIDDEQWRQTLNRSVHWRVALIANCNYNAPSMTLHPFSFISSLCSNNDLLVTELSADRYKLNRYFASIIITSLCGLTYHLAHCLMMSRQHFYMAHNMRLYN